MSQFSKTPSNIVCGRFWELRWAFGCPFNCAYCYLRGTSRGNMRPRYVKLETVLATLDSVFADASFNNGQPALFNSGELCDSLMNPTYMAAIADKFEEQKKHRLVLVTKAAPSNAAFLLEKPRRNVIAVWSVNSNEAAKRWEIGASSPDERIRAAADVSAAGCEVRLRIDPIFPIPQWQSQYADLAHRILAAFRPTRIILGTPRGLWKTLHYAEKAGVDTSWTRYFAPEETGWGKKLTLEDRTLIYRFMYDTLDRLGFPKTRISICKETRDLYEVLGLSYKPLTCQCYSQ
jgi:spore photoproduct lyase